MLDAPVSGGMEGARTRDLLVMAGGDLATFERARPLLDAVAKRVLHTGGIGTGSIAKIMHNSASFTLDLVMAECGGKCVPPVNHPAEQCIAYHAVDSALPALALAIEPPKIALPAVAPVVLPLPFSPRIAFDSRAPPVLS